MTLALTYTVINLVPHCPTSLRIYLTIEGRPTQASVTLSTFNREVYAVSDLAELLQSTSFIIWDKISSPNRYCFKSVSRTFVGRSPRRMVRRNTRFIRWYRLHHRVDEYRQLLTSPFYHSQKVSGRRSWLRPSCIFHSEGCSIIQPERMTPARRLKSRSIREMAIDSGRKDRRHNPPH